MALDFVQNGDADMTKKETIDYIGWEAWRNSNLKFVKEHLIEGRGVVVVLEVAQSSCMTT